MEHKILRAHFIDLSVCVFGGREKGEKYRRISGGGRERKKRKDICAPYVGYGVSRASGRSVCKYDTKRALLFIHVVNMTLY